MAKFKVTDQRVIEACNAQGFILEAMTPEGRFEAYLRYTLPSITNPAGWAPVLIDVAKGCGYKIN